MPLGKWAGTIEVKEEGNALTQEKLKKALGEEVHLFDLICAMMNSDINLLI